MQQHQGTIISPDGQASNKTRRENTPPEKGSTWNPSTEAWKECTGRKQRTAHVSQFPTGGEGRETSRAKEQGTKSGGEEEHENTSKGQRKTTANMVGRQMHTNTQATTGQYPRTGNKNMRYNRRSVRNNLEPNPLQRKGKS